MSKRYSFVNPLCFTLFAATLSASPWCKAESEINFTIPAAPLADSLLQFSEISGVKVFFSSQLTDRLRANAVQGLYTPEQALQILLDGSGLATRTAVDGTVILEKSTKSVEPQSTNSATMPAVTVVGQSVSAPEDPYNPSYTRTKASSVTKTDTPILESPMSVQLIPKSVISDQKYSRLKDALENVSGVRPQNTLGLGTRYIVRGFENPRIYRNGLISNAADSYFSTEIDTANLESIEVLKGPAGMLFGRTEPGGLINLVTKQPLDTPYYSLEQQFGSYDHYRTLWDATGPIDSDKALLYRFTGSFQDVGSFRDFVSSDRKMFNPSFTWRASERTELKLDVEGFEQNFQGNLGIPAVGNRPARIPIRRSFGDPNEPRDSVSKVHVGTELTHKFNEDWMVRNRFLSSFLHGNDTYLLPMSLDADGRTLHRNVFAQSSEQESYATNLDVLGKFNIGQTKHNVLMGFDYLRSNTNYTLSGQFFFHDPRMDIDIFNPQYGVDQQLILQTARNVPFPNFNVFKSEWYGVYFQDDIAIFDKLHILGGGRHDWAARGRGNATNFDSAGDNTQMVHNNKFSPRVGLLYEVLPTLSVYGNWTNTFSAYPAINGSGEPVKPQTSEQFEAGLKGALPEGQLSWTLAYYHLTKENILTPDRSTPDPNDSAPIGQARSQGLELDVAGEIAEGLNLIGSYAYTDTRIIKDGFGNEGNRLTNVPEHSGSAWLKYDFKHLATLTGLQLGIGAYAAGQRQGNNENTFQLPGYARLDALLGYKWKVGKSLLTTQLNIRNLLDKTYYDSTDPVNNADPTLSIYPGAPLSFYGTVKVEF